MQLFSYYQIILPGSYHPSLVPPPTLKSSIHQLNCTLAHHAINPLNKNENDDDDDDKTENENKPKTIILHTHTHTLPTPTPTHNTPHPHGTRHNTHKKEEYSREWFGYKLKYNR